MKIEKTSNPLPANQVSEGRVAPQQKNGTATKSAAQPESTSVSLGSTAAHLRSMEGGYSSTPAINAAKVAEIKQAISEGRFKINSEVIADRLISTVHELIGNKA